MQQQTVVASEKIYHPFFVVGSCDDGSNNLSKFDKSSFSTRSIDRLPREQNLKCLLNNDGEFKFCTRSIDRLPREQNLNSPSLFRRHFTISLDNELHKQRCGSGRQHLSNLRCSNSAFHSNSSIAAENILPGVECKRITSSKRESGIKTVVKDKKVNGKTRKKICIKPKTDLSPSSPNKNVHTSTKETKKKPSRITFSFTKRAVNNNKSNERISIKSFFSKKKNTVHDPSIKFNSPCSSPSKKRTEYLNHNNNNDNFRDSLSNSPQKNRRIYYSEKQSLSDAHGIPMVPPSTPGKSLFMG